MKPPLLLICIAALFAAPQLPAQVPSYREVLDNLAKAAPAAPVDLPPAFFQYADTTAPGQLQRGIVLYAAAGRARECNNLDRVPILIAGAKIRLLYAKEHLPASQNAQKAQCLYYLGLIAEKQEGDQAAAASYYEQAGNTSNNPGAQNAGGRLKRAHLH